MNDKKFIFLMILLFYFGIGLAGSMLVLSSLPKFGPFVVILYNMLKVVIVVWLLFLMRLIVNNNSLLKLK